MLSLTMYNRKFILMVLTLINNYVDQSSVTRILFLKILNNHIKNR